MSGEISRRRVLAGLLVTMAGAGMSGVRAMAARPDRIAVIDWALLETLLAIGITPVAAAELVQYRQTVIEPPLPAGVIDLGLRGALNFEVLRLAAPDLILNSGFHAWADPNLARIAPVLSLSIHRPDAAPYAAAEAASKRNLGRVIFERVGPQGAPSKLRCLFTAAAEWKNLCDKRSTYTRY